LWVLRSVWTWTVVLEKSWGKPVHSGHSVFLGYDSALMDDRIPTLRGNIVSELPLKMRTLHVFSFSCSSLLPIDGIAHKMPSLEHVTEYYCCTWLQFG
jgi:hypothetical protein